MLKTTLNHKIVNIFKNFFLSPSLPLDKAIFLQMEGALQQVTCSSKGILKINFFTDVSSSAVY